MFRGNKPIQGGGIVADQKKALDSRVQTISNSLTDMDPEFVARCGQRKRFEQREQIFRPAKVYTGRNTSIRCIVLDVNAKGARIALDGNLDLPEVVILKFDQTKEARSARVVWRDRNEYGLSYRMTSWQKPPVVFKESEAPSETPSSA